MLKKINKLFILFFISLLFMFVSPDIVKAGDEDLSNVTDLSDLMEDDVFSFTSGTPLDKSEMKFQVNKTDVEDKDFWQKIFDEYHDLIVFISAVCTMTFVVLFLITFIKLGGSAGNPQQRKTYSIALLWTASGAILSGGVLIFVALGFGVLRKAK